MFPFFEAQTRLRRSEHAILNEGIIDVATGTLEQGTQRHGLNRTIWPGQPVSVVDTQLDGSATISIRPQTGKKRPKSFIA